MTKKYTTTHEWIEADGDSYIIGISDFAQSLLGDVVMVEMPDKDKVYNKGDNCAVIESVKAASDIYCPFEGTITDINLAIEDAPELVNTSAETDGWLWKMSAIADPNLDSFMDKAAYEEYISGLES